MRLLIVDGSNIAMRASLGGDIHPDQSTGTATGIIERCAREYEATHLVVALDSPTGMPSWRKVAYPEYKANRTRDTTPWLAAGMAAWLRCGWWVEEHGGFEADDLIATLALRVKARGDIFVLSGDSDLLPLLADGIHLVKPVNGGQFSLISREAMCAKYGLANPAQLVDLKAMTGEAGDNVPGVDGIGTVRAQQLLARHATLDAVIAAGRAGACKFSAKVLAQEAIARLAYSLISLNRAAPVLPIPPAHCAL